MRKGLKRQFDFIHDIIKRREREKESNRKWVMEERRRQKMGRGREKR